MKIINDNFEDISFGKSKKIEKKTISFRECFEKAIDNWNKKNPHQHKKIDGYLSISSIAGNACMRKVYYDYIKADKQPLNYKSQIIMDLGTRMHEFYQDVLGSEGYLDGIEFFMQDDELKICGSTDGWLVDKENNEIVLNDIKSCNLNTYTYVSKTNKPKKDHKHQCHLYAYILNKYYGHNISKMKVTYLCKNQSYFTPNLDNEITTLKMQLKNLEEYCNIYHHDYDIDDIEDATTSLKQVIERLEFEKEISTLDDFLIKEVDFDYDEKVIEEEIKKINKFWDLIESNKTAKKEKLPNKISNKTFCGNCQYRGVCRQID